MSSPDGSFHGRPVFIDDQDGNTLARALTSSAHSAGTLMSLGADRILLTKLATPTPSDPLGARSGRSLRRSCGSRSVADLFPHTEHVELRTMLER